MNLPGFQLHQLKGERRVNGGLSIRQLALVFVFEGEDASEIDLVDYH